MVKTMDKKKRGAVAANTFPPKEILILDVQSEVETCQVTCSNWSMGKYNGKQARFGVESFTLNGYRYDIQIAKVKA